MWTISRVRIERSWRRRGWAASGTCVAERRDAFGRYVLERGDVDQLSIEREHAAEARVAEAKRAGRNGFENRLGVRA